MTADPTLLDRAVERLPMVGHDGRSGARLERIVLDDGTRLVVKRTSSAVDLVMRLHRAAVSREYELWREGILGRLPRGVGHAILGAWVDGDDTVLVMRDLGDAVVGWEHRLSRQSWRHILRGATAVHRAFQGAAVGGLCPLVDRISLFAPWRMAPERDAGNLLAAAVLGGWERFAEIVTADVAEAVFGVLERPDRLGATLSERAATLLHGDLWLVNVALEADQLTLLDWDLATWGPPALEFALFLNGNSSQIDATRDELVDDFRSVWGDEHDEVALRLALFAGLADLGWNKALDAVEHDDGTVRARARAELDWWVAQARRTLELGLLGTPAGGGLDSRASARRGPPPPAPLGRAP
jgi:hypothetical protein